MNLHDADTIVAGTPADTIFAAPWRDLDDAALLAHFRSARPVFVDLVVDHDECPPERLDGVLQGRFEFNGETHALPDPIDWLANPSADIEWQILLHKFYYAAGLGQRYLATGDARIARRWAALIDGWIDQVAPGFIAADVTGRRVQNWIYSTRAFVAHGVPHEAPVDPAFFRRLLRSLHTQVEFLCSNLTPKRNHRTLELYAIFLSGVAFPEMERAAHWREFAMAQTLANLRADLLDDGVHCELSTDYHHLAVRNWLHVRTLAQRHGVAVPCEMDRLLERALEFSLHVHKPDGVVPSLSDGDARSYLALLGQGADLYGRADMRWVASRGEHGTPPAHTLACFESSGYCVVRSDWGLGAHDFADAQYLVFDCGPLGEGNHGHFDCLSFELAAHGRSLVVDPGRYTYSEAGDINWRVHFRGTSAHNTVCVDGHHQTRYEPRPIKEASRHTTGSVRHKIAGPAPVATLREAVQAPGFHLLHGHAASAAYDAMHERVIVRLGALWVVSDWLRAGSEHDYTLRFQLGAPAHGRSRVVDGTRWRIDSPGLVLLQPARTGIRTTLAAGWVSPQYGHKHPAPAVVSHARGRDVDFDTVLLPGNGTPPAAQAMDAADTSGVLHIEHAAQGETLFDTWLHARAEGRVQRRFDGFEFEGRWLLLRRDAQGRVLHALSHAGATLHRAGRRLPTTVATEVRK